MTDYLFAKPSLVYGVARTLDLGAMLDSYNISPTPEMADFLAMLSDWMVVGTDLRAAIERALGEHRETRQVA